jgi:hypothetical protein
MWRRHVTVHWMFSMKHCWKAALAFPPQRTKGSTHAGGCLKVMAQSWLLLSVSLVYGAPSLSTLGNCEAESPEAIRQMKSLLLIDSVLENSEVSILTCNTMTGVITVDGRAAAGTCVNQCVLRYFRRRTAEARIRFRAMRGAWRRGMGVNSREAVIKTSWGKPVYVIPFIRTLIFVLG